jgi:hypothetical protein
LPSAQIGRNIASGEATKMRRFRAEDSLLFISALALAGVIAVFLLM